MSRKSHEVDENAEERAGAARLHKEYGLGPYDTAAHAAGTKKGSRRRAGLSG